MTFDFGVASGDLTDCSAVLWTRTKPLSPVRWEVQSTLDGVSYCGETMANAEGFVHVMVAGLTPKTSWRYQFCVDGERSGWGRFRTLPRSGPVKFAVVSCAKYNSGFFNAYGVIAERDDLDFVLHLGDYIYEAGQVPRGNQTPGIDIGRPFEPLHECVTLDDYGRRYAQYHHDSHLLALHAAHGWIFTLDDHEIADNAWSGGADDHRPSDGPWQERLHNALTAWQQWLPTQRRPAAGDALWQSVAISDVAQLFLCDSRLSRTDPRGPDCTEKSVLGEAQVAALINTATAGQAPWFLVGMPSKFLSLEDARRNVDSDLVLRKLKLSDREGAAFHDRWDAYSHERDRLVDLFDGLPGRPVVLCGDVHFAAFSQVGTGGLAECVTSSVTSPNFDDKMGWAYGGASRPYEEKLVSTVPELQWCDLDRHGFLIVEITREQFTCEWWGVTTVTEPTVDAVLLHRVELSTT